MKQRNKIRKYKNWEDKKEFFINYLYSVKDKDYGEFRISLNGKITKLKQQLEQESSWVKRKAIQETIDMFEMLKK